MKRFRAELERQLEYDISSSAQSDIEYWIRDVANDERESVIVYDLETNETLFVRYGNRHSVTLQDWHQRLSEGRNIVVIHNHPKLGGASWADLSSATWLDAEWLLVVNPDGKVHRHQKIDGGLVELEPWNFPEFVAPVNPVETVLHSIAYWIQTAREIGNPAEAVFRQEERDPGIHEQSFQTEAAPIDPDYVRYAEPAAPEEWWLRGFDAIARNTLWEASGFRAQAVTRAAEFSGSRGYDDASHNIRHFLGGSGDAIDDLSVDKMIDELPLFRADIIQNVRDSLLEKIANGELEPVDISEDSTTYAFPTEWRFVGSQGKAEADVYGFREEALNTGTDATCCLRIHRKGLNKRYMTGISLWASSTTASV